jgi:hypothetical protein
VIEFRQVSGQPKPTQYLGLGTVVTTPPGPVSVLVPLPLFSSKPSPPPGRINVCMEPTCPVEKAGPRGVRTAWPAPGAGGIPLLNPPFGKFPAELSSDCPNEVPADRLRTAAIVSNKVLMVGLRFGIGSMSR